MGDQNDDQKLLTYKLDIPLSKPSTRTATLSDDDDKLRGLHLPQTVTTDIGTPECWISSVSASLTDQWDQQIHLMVGLDKVQVRPGRLAAPIDAHEGMVGYFIDQIRITVDVIRGWEGESWHPVLRHAGPNPDLSTWSVGWSEQHGVSATAGSFTAVGPSSGASASRSYATKDFQIFNSSDDRRVEILYGLAAPDARERPYNLNRPGYSLLPEIQFVYDEAPTGVVFQAFKPGSAIWNPDARRLTGPPASATSGINVEAVGHWAIVTPEGDVKTNWGPDPWTVEIHVEARYVFVWSDYEPRLTKEPTYAIFPHVHDAVYTGVFWPSSVAQIITIMMLDDSDEAKARVERVIESDDNQRQKVWSGSE